MILATTKQRIIYLLEKKGITKPIFYEKTGIKRGLLDKDKLDSAVSDVYIAKILAIFPDLNLEWLITGQGSMLRAEHSQVAPTPPVQEASGEVAAYYRLYKEKDEENKELLKENAVLKERLRLYESEHPDLKKDVKDVSTGSTSSRVSHGAPSASAPLKG